MIAEGNSVTAETVWADGQEFITDLDAKCDTLRIKAGATIYFRNGIHFKLECQKLIVEGPVTIDGRGVDGKPAITPPKKPDVYASGTPAQHQFQIHPVFLKWVTDASYGYFGNDALPATNGNPGARIQIRYREFEGQLFPTAVFVSGGKGGAGASGGEGATAHCTCGAVLQAGSGRGVGPGLDGQNGAFHQNDTDVRGGGES